MVRSTSRPRSVGGRPEHEMDFDGSHEESKNRVKLSRRLLLMGPMATISAGEIVAVAFLPHRHAYRRRNRNGDRCDSIGAGENPREHACAKNSRLSGLIAG